MVDGTLRGQSRTIPLVSSSSYDVFTHRSMRGREVQNQNLQKCMKVGCKMSKS
jgi:hypothetical protein